MSKSQDRRLAIQKGLSEEDLIELEYVGCRHCTKLIAEVRRLRTENKNLELQIGFLKTKANSLKFGENQKGGA